MGFKPAKTEALRSFVVLDSEDVLSGLSALDGGAVDEILTRRTDDDMKDRGVEVGTKGTSAKANRNRGRKVEEEMRRRRTEHSAAAALIDGLTEREAIGEIDGALDEEVAGQLTPGDTVRLRGEVMLHPLHQVDGGTARCAPPPVHLALTSRTVTRGSVCREHEGKPSLPTEVLTLLLDEPVAL